MALVSARSRRSEKGDVEHYDDEEYDEIPDKTCQFCLMYDETFTDPVLDMHWWQDCPMLTRCASCEQVIEISCLNDHLLHECDKSYQHKECPRCHEAIKASVFDKHVKRNKCLPARSLDIANRCPLCHQDIPPGEDGWRTHLLKGRGCPKNLRTAL